MMPFGFRDFDDAMHGVTIGILLLAAVMLSPLLEGKQPMMTVSLILALTAFICIILSALNYCPLWIGALLLAILELLRALPMGR